jgi:hypothetical protein
MFCLLRLARSLSSLRVSGALAGRVVWYVIEDTTAGCRPATQDALRRICAPVDIEAVVIGRARSRQLQHVLSRASGRNWAQAWLRQPGCGNWDAAGVRNLAAITAACVAAPDDLICWIDDDILLSEIDKVDAANSGYNWDRISKHLRGGLGVRAALERLRRSTRLVVGVRYVGVVDLSTRNHIAIGLRRLREGPTTRLTPERDGSLSVWWPEGAFPTIVDYEGNGDGLYAYRGPGGVSSGFMVTRAEVLFRFPFPRFYNEDWLWLLLLGPTRLIAEQSRQPVAHVPPPPSLPRVSHLIHEEAGEIAFDALSDYCRGERNARETITLLTSQDALVELIEHQKRHRVRELLELENELRDSRWGTQGAMLAAILENTRVGLAKLRAPRLAAQIRETTRGASVWRREMANTAMIEAVGDVVRSFQC